MFFPVLLLVLMLAQSAQLIIKYHGSFCVLSQFLALVFVISKSTSREVKIASVR